MKKNEFIKSVEKMIDPIEVGTVHFMQSYATPIPKSVLYKIISSGSKTNPYMGFVVEPYSFFVGYEIVDLEWAKKLIPDNYKLVKSKIFDNEEPKYYSIFGCFNIHTSVFWGTRMEFYIIAENTDTGLLSWVIVDYDTNTVSYDKKQGLTAGNTKECILTTNYNEEVIVDIKGNKDNREIVATANLSNSKKEDLDNKLWIEGNLSVAYGRDIAGDYDQAFATIFSPKEVKSALDVPLSDVEINVSNWFNGLIASKPSKVACFQYAQHYLSDSPGHFSQINNEKELKSKYNDFDFSKISKYSSSSIKKSFKIGQVVSMSLIMILTILLILK